MYALQQLENHLKEGACALDVGSGSGYLTAAMAYMVIGSPGGALGYFLGGYVPPGSPNWHPVLEKISPKIDTPF